jgi:hypothetical protein
VQLPAHLLRHTEFIVLPDFIMVLNLSPLTIIVAGSCPTECNLSGFHYSFEFIFVNNHHGRVLAN